MTDAASFVIGGVTYPLTASTTNSLLRDADPALFYALDFFASVLRTHLEARMIAEANRLNLPLSGAVVYTNSIDPGKHPIDTRYRFPLLSVFRQKSKYGYRTINWAERTSKWGVTYLLPVLSTIQAEALNPILKAVGDVLADRIELGFDPAYNSGQKVWAAAGLDEISIDEDEWNLFSVPDGVQYFPGITCSLTVKERTMPTPLTAMTGADVEIDLATTGQTTINDFVDFKSDVVPPGPTDGGG